jgi:hypothetical protein
MTAEQVAQNDSTRSDEAKQAVANESAGATVVAAG